MWKLKEGKGFHDMKKTGTKNDRFAGYGKQSGQPYKVLIKIHKRIIPSRAYAVKFQEREF